MQHLGTRLASLALPQTQTPFPLAIPRVGPSPGRRIRISPHASGSRWSAACGSGVRFVHRPIRRLMTSTNSFHTVVLVVNAILSTAIGSWLP
ncbi:hypothetical protein VTH06DRAFT_641 [Thermothelomyces fergusii]